jgi:hypothetical protein
LKKIFFIFFLLVSDPIFASLPHPFHTSVTEIVFNEKDQLWEVSIRLFQDDLEVGLSAFQGKKFQFLPKLDVDEILAKFVKTHVGFQVNRKLQTPYRYIGFEPQKDVVWIYLEIPTLQELKGVYFQNSLLVDVFPDQTNLVHVARLDKKKSYLFKKDAQIILLE